MAREPHHLLARCFHQNLEALAKVLDEQQQDATQVDILFARSVVLEMRRSHDHLKAQSKAHLLTLSPELQVELAAYAQQMEVQWSSLEDHLSLLEQEVRLAAPGVEQVADMAVKMASDLSRMQALHEGLSGSTKALKGAVDPGALPN